MLQFLKSMKNRVVVWIRAAASDVAFELSTVKSVLMDHRAEGYVDTAIIS